MSNTTQPIRLSASQLEAFERDGYLLLPGLLDESEVAHYISVVDELERRERAEKNLSSTDSIEIRDSVARAPELLPLISHPAALGAMLDILGWDIQLTTSHTFVRVPNPDAQTAFKAIDWHNDGPKLSVPTGRGAVQPRLYAKIGYFFTDLSQPDAGNLRVVPGSNHLSARPPLDENGEPEGAIQILTKPGDAVLFENRLWHAVGPNYAGVARKNVYIGYCHRWMKAIDFLRQSDELLQRASAVERQLLGQASDALSFYLPDRYSDDVPLRELA